MLQVNNFTTMLQAQVEEAEEEGADTPKHTGKPAKEPPEEPAAAPDPPPAAAPAAEQPAQAEAPSQPAPGDAPAAASGGAAGEAAKESKEDPAAAKQPEAAAAEAEPAAAKEAGAAAPAQPVVQDQAVTGLLQVRPAGNSFLPSKQACALQVLGCALFMVTGITLVCWLAACCQSTTPRSAACPGEGACAGAGGRAPERAGHAAAAVRRRHVPAGAPSIQGLSALRKPLNLVEVCQVQAHGSAQQQQRGW